MQSLFHESSELHVTGKAVFVDDILTDTTATNAYIYYSSVASAKIKQIDIYGALQIDGVQAILSAKDIPGINQIGAVKADEEILAQQTITHQGQAILIIVAKDNQTAEKAKSAIKIELEPLPHTLTIEQAMAADSKLQEPRMIQKGNTSEAFSKCDHFLEGELETGAQEHWYLETQTCLCVPLENDTFKLYSSTQNPAETQSIVANALNLPIHNIEIETNRLGGAFGGKETQANHVAVWTALVSYHTKKTAKIKLSRNDDQIITGKRHPFLVKYKVGFSKTGKIEALETELHSNAGSSTDLSMAIIERAMLHAENSYYIPNIKIVGTVWRTNIPSNTAFRGFGGPQAIAAIENIIDRIARFIQTDAADVRLLNFYKKDTENTTPYQMTFENNQLELIWHKIMKISNYRQKRLQIGNFNSTNEYLKQGLALSTVKFGISFTNAFLNQAGALVNIYKDGSVLINHGGVEMGQGLHTKIRQIAAGELGIGIDNIKICNTNTSKVPNTSATAASTGTDLNGMAVKNAITKLKMRLSKIFFKQFNNKAGDFLPHKNSSSVVFKDGLMFDSKKMENKIPFKQIVPIAIREQVSLSATGYYHTPGIFMNRESGQGKPFHYFATGMAVSHIQLDILTGEVKILETNIVHDCGKSINKQIDLGQIRGAFVQGLGWCTCEDIKWNDNGKLLSNSPDTYKIPTVGNIPEVLTIELHENNEKNDTIKNSKAVGEPPFMHGLSVWLAIKDAISATKKHETEPFLKIPATNENIILTIRNLLLKI